MAIIAWGSYIFLVWDLGGQREELKLLRANIAFHENRYNEIQDTVVFLNDTEGRIEDIKGYFLANDEKSIVSFIRELEDLGRRTNVEFEISNLSVSNNEGDDLLSADINMIGEWEKINKTIALIELLPYKVSVTNARIRQEGTSWSSSFKINVLMAN